MTTYPNQKFTLGQIVMTQGAAQLMHDKGIYPTDLIQRHASGDWGNLCEEDKAVNEASIKTGGMIMSQYGEGEDRLWLITDSGHAVTTLLLPSEY